MLRRSPFPVTLHHEGAMVSNQEYFREQASRMRSEADATVLGNVRERCLRSAAAWDLMADRVARGERARADLIARKAAGES